MTSEFRESRKQGVEQQQDTSNTSDAGSSGQSTEGAVDAAGKASANITVHVQDPLSGLGTPKDTKPEYTSIPKEVLEKALKQIPQVSGVSPNTESQDLQNFVIAAKKAARDAGDKRTEVAREAKKILGLIRTNAHSETAQVDPDDLEMFTRRVVLGAIQIIGDEELRHVVEEILSDHSNLEMLRQMTETSRQLTAAANHLTNKIAPAGTPDHNNLGLLVLGAVVLFAAGAGVIVPLLTGSAIAQTILANEVALAAVAVGAAALIKRG